VSIKLGVELKPTSVHAVAVSNFRGRVDQTFSCVWDGQNITPVVNALRARFPHTSSLALSVGVGFLHIKRVQLPPVPDAERRRIIAFEPDRFFAVQEKRLALSLIGDIAFAVDAHMLQEWLGAFSQWRRVEVVEPAPLSLARSVGDGAYMLPADGSEKAIVVVAGGQPTTARRVPANESVQANPLPETPVAAEYLCALGATRSSYEPLHTMLLTDELARPIRMRRAAQVSLAGVFCVLSLLALLTAASASRDRTLARINAEIANLQPQAAPALQASFTLANMNRERELLGARSGSKPLEVLRALSQRLPPGAIVLSLHGDQTQWQIEGTAPDASAIVPALARDQRFQDVRPLAASSRYQDAARAYETFSIGFRVAAN
jgi:hypothetical protein